jgi:hypothetical protein
MLHNFFRLLKAFVAMIFRSMLGPEHRIGAVIHLRHEWIRLTTSYEAARKHAVDVYGSSDGITGEVFDEYYQREKSRYKHLRPIDAYYAIMEDIETNFNTNI